jgi:hypothetical protein
VGEGVPNWQVSECWIYLKFVAEIDYSFWLTGPLLSEGFGLQVQNVPLRDLD